MSAFDQPLAPAKFEVGQFFLQKEKRKLFKIVNAEWQGIITKESTSKVKEHVREINDWLYDIQYLKPEGKREYGRYYEARLSNECTLMDNQKLPQSIYE